jgi:molybdopterin synthase sulfur carrier subunit
MVKVKIRFFASLREIAGKREDVVELTGEVDVNALLREVVRKHGEKLYRRIFDEFGNVNENLQFLVNGVDVSKLRGMETTLKDGDVVAILPPVGGG